MAIVSWKGDSEKNLYINKERDVRRAERLAANDFVSIKQFTKQVHCTTVPLSAGASSTIS